MAQDPCCRPASGAADRSGYGGPVTTPDWDRRLTETWASLDESDEAGFHARIDALVAELPADDPVGCYARGGALDSTGHPDRAVPLYREALRRGLPVSYRRQATISLASSLRNLDRAGEAVELLAAELATGAPELTDAVRGFLALALVDAGREREAVGVALTALAPHVPRYRRSLTNYARELVAPDQDGHDDDRHN